MASKQSVKQFLQLRQQFWGKLSTIRYSYDYVRSRLFYTTETIESGVRGITTLINLYGTAQDFAEKQNNSPKR